MTIVTVPGDRNDLIARLSYLYGCERRLFWDMTQDDLLLAFAAITAPRTQ